MDTAQYHQWAAQLDMNRKNSPTGGRLITRFRLGVTEGNLVNPSAPTAPVAGLYVGATCGVGTTKSLPLAVVASDIKLLALFAAIPVADDLEADLVRPILLNPVLEARTGEVGDGGT